jgi:fluoroquinolone resistance protein
MNGLLADARREYEGQSFVGLSLQREEIPFKEFYGCQFTRCSFLETAFHQCSFVDCEFAECDLSLCRVEACIFSNTVFRDSQVVGVNWTEASWPKRGLLRGIDFYDCAISHSTFIGLSLKEINLSGCTAHNADFAEADLSRATCTGTDFADSRFLHTNLTEADFVGARNYAISPPLNVLKKTRFSLPEAVSLLYALDIVLSE